VRCAITHSPYAHARIPGPIVPLVQLWAAAGEGKTAEVRRLVEAGAEIHSRDPNNVSACVCERDAFLVADAILSISCCAHISAFRIPSTRHQRRVTPTRPLVVH
jgi:hypothetical protein